MKFSSCENWHFNTLAALRWNLRSLPPLETILVWPECCKANPGRRQCGFLIHLSWWRIHMVHCRHSQVLDGTLGWRCTIWDTHRVPPLRSVIFWSLNCQRRVVSPNSHIPILQDREQRRVCLGTQPRSKSSLYSVPPNHSSVTRHHCVFL